MVEAVVCFFLVGFLLAGCAFAFFARRVFAQRQRAGIRDTSFLAMLFTDDRSPGSSPDGLQLIPVRVETRDPLGSVDER